MIVINCFENLLFWVVCSIDRALHAKIDKPISVLRHQCRQSVNKVLKLCLSNKPAFLNLETEMF